MPKKEGKSIVFGAVRMNTIYKSDPSSLVQKSDEWFGDSVGRVFGCLSHVSVNGDSYACDSKLAIQCDVNDVSWKSVGIYARLEDEGSDDQILFACESIQNGEYKDVTIVELPVTLDGVVEDFGLSEGGSGGGGGDVPANMMTTNTYQQVFGAKQWLWKIYEGKGTEDKPQEGDMLKFKILSIGSNTKGEDLPDPIVFNSAKQDFVRGAWQGTGNSIVVLDASGVTLNDGSDATWANIINAANRSVADIRASQDDVKDDGEGNLMVFGDTIQPDYSISVDGMLFTFDSSGYLESVCLDGGSEVATIGVIVRDQYGDVVANGRVNGVSMGAETPLTFQSPIQLAAGYQITYQVIISHL